MNNSEEEISRKAQDNLDNFNKFYNAILKACIDVSITEEQGVKFIDSLNKYLDNKNILRIINKMY